MAVMGNSAAGNPEPVSAPMVSFSPLLQAWISGILPGGFTADIPISDLVRHPGSNAAAIISHRHIFVMSVMTKKRSQTAHKRLGASANQLIKETLN